jgi:hypothetical protein
MKRKAPPHGKKESADMETGATPNIGSFEKRSDKRLEKTETKPSDQIIELRQKIRSGYYDSKEVIMQIVNKLLSEIKLPKE